MIGIFNVLLILAGLVIWLLIGYQLLFSIAGLVLFRRSLGKSPEVSDRELPEVTILIPAHNEAKVIERSIRSLLALDYPADRLRVLVVDDASTDATPFILEHLAREDGRVRVLTRLPGEGGRGKGAALNAALGEVRSDYIAIYDADNRPEPDALKYLVAPLLRHPELGAAAGRFRTGNKRRNLLTRFINLEGLGFQGIFQAGRWQLLGIAALSGTNYLVRKRVLKKLGGWDEAALTEDTELSVRMYQAGYRIAFVPPSVSWEQEPETLGVWLKQRRRWARGNNYTIVKLLRCFRRSPSKQHALEALFTLCIPYFLLFAFLSSQVAGIVTLFHVNLSGMPGAIWHFWGAAMVLYTLEVILVLSYDREASLENLAVSILMYFSYCQVWLMAILGALYSDLIRREKRVWYKTLRFDSEIEPSLPRRSPRPLLPGLSDFIPGGPLAKKSPPLRRRRELTVAKAK